MTTVDETRQQAIDLVGVGDPNRAIVVILTPFKLAALHLHIANYIDVMQGHENSDELIGILTEIQDDVQLAVTQILQSQYPPS